jgi:hypothetical protein
MPLTLRAQLSAGWRTNLRHGLLLSMSVTNDACGSEDQQVDSCLQTVRAAANRATVAHRMTRVLLRRVCSSWTCLLVQCR